MACAGGRAIGGDALAMQVRACMTVRALTDFNPAAARHMHVVIARIVSRLRRRDDQVGWCMLRL